MSVMSELLHSLLTVLLLQFAIIFIVKTLTNKNQKISDFFYSFLSSFSPNIESNLPHPQSFPFVGNLLQLRVRPLETLNKWSKEYGPVYSINLGQKLFVILNNHEVVNELIVKGSSNYTFRYDFDNINRVLIKSNSLAMAPYGSEWKSHRLIVHNALLPRPITSYYGYITNEVNQLTNNILSKHSQLISPLQIIKKFVLKSMLNILFGDQIDESFFNDVMKLLDDIAEFSTPISVINDFIPVLDHIYKPSDLKAEKVCERMEQLFSSKYDQFLRDYSQKDKNLSPSILAQIQESNEKGNNSMDYEDIWKMLVSLLNKSFQTEVSTLMWTIACLANNPGVQQEAFSELDDACKNMPSMEEEVDLPYINAIINEALRYRPPNPFGFSHITNKDVDYRGYLIPKGTPLLLNLFAINHNEKRFITPDKFRPSRFLPEYSTGSVKSRSILLPQLDFDSNIETNGEEERLANKRMSSLKILLKNNSPSLTNESMPMHMSFGAGKRYCIGQHLAQKQMFLTIARILWAFEIKPGTGEDGETPLEINLDDGKLSLTSYFPNPYKVRFSLRKDISLLL